MVMAIVREENAESCVTVGSEARTAGILASWLKALVVN